MRLPWLANTPRDGAVQLAERIRRELARHPHMTGDGTPLRVTASLGVATLHGSASKELLLTQADQALYRAKRGGRNRVEASLH